MRPSRTIQYSSSENGDLTSENGDLASENGDLVSENGDLASGNGDLASENGDLASGNGDLASGTIFGPKVFGLSMEMVTLQRYRKCVAIRGLGELAARDCGWSRQWPH